MTSLSDYRVLVAPGLHSSGADHWQTRWEKRYPNFQRVEQDDWAQPELLRWSQRMTEVLLESDEPTLIVAHSFGCLATMHAASHGRFDLAGALLVAPADPEKFGVDHLLRDAHLPCPSIVIGSTNDPWMAGDRAAYWADIWGSDFISAGALGHINSESNLGDWEQGLQQLQKLLDRAQADYN